MPSARATMVVDTQQPLLLTSQTTLRHARRQTRLRRPWVSRRVLPHIIGGYPMDPNLRVCSHCQATMPFTAFTGPRAQCKACHAASERERRARDPEGNRAVQRRWRQRNRDACRAMHKRTRLRHPDHHNARKVVYRAIRRGELVREPCSRCDATAEVHAHHDDYGHPYDVTWLCRRCHERLHTPRAVVTAEGTA